MVLYVYRKVTCARTRLVFFFFFLFLFLVEMRLITQLHWFSVLIPNLGVYALLR